MKKRGEATLWFLIELIAAIFIVYMAIDISNAYAQGTIFEKLNIARDISMQINTLSSLPGDAYIVNNNLHGYSLRFINNKVQVFENINEISTGVHSFVAIKAADFSLILEKPNQVVISKIGDDIIISKDILSIN